MVAWRSAFIALSLMALPWNALRAQDVDDGDGTVNDQTLNDETAGEGRAAQTSETCYKKTAVLAQNNAQVLGWIDSTKNGYEARAHVTGKVLKLFNIQDGHTHISVQIGKTAAEAIEVVYSNEYGTLPKLTAGTAIEACGDYITSFKAAGGEPASADGAIIHWVHASDTKSHESGFVVVNGKVYGND